MSITNSVEKIREWVEQTVCPLIKLKLPPDEDTLIDEIAADDGGYSYKLVNPATFALYVPTSDRLPPRVPAPIPSVCVRLIDGKDKLVDSIRDVRIQLAFSTWDPGLHGRDVWQPFEGEPSKFIQQINEKTKELYIRSGVGWQDAWNFVDIALREIENAEYIGGLRLVKEEGVDFGAFKEQEAIPDYYPYWFAWAEFSLEESLIRTKSSYEQYL